MLLRQHMHQWQGHGPGYVKQEFCKQTVQEQMNQACLAGVRLEKKYMQFESSQFQMWESFT